MNAYEFSKEFVEKIDEEENNRLLLEVRNGNSEARNKAIMCNTRLVYYRVYNFYLGYQTERDDFISLGFVGLIRAVDTYEFDRNCKFSTYAIKCIDNEIQKYIKKNKKYEMIDSLDRNINDDNVSLIELIDGNINLEDDWIRGELRLFLDDYVKKLKGNNRKIIELFLGLNCNEVYSQTEISEMLSVTRSYVSAVVRKELTKMRNMLNIKGYIEFDNPKEKIKRMRKKM